MQKRRETERERTRWINVFQMGLEMRGGGVLVGQAWLHSVAHKLIHTHTHLDTHALRQLPALIAALVCLTTQNILCLAGDSQ